MFDLKEFYSKLDSFYSQHDNSGAEAYMLECRDRAKQSAADDAPKCSCCKGGDTIGSQEVNLGYVSVVNELACYYRGMSDFDKSLENFDLALGELRSTGNQNTQEYGTVLLNKAGTYRYMGKLDEALDCFDAAAMIFNGLGDVDPAVMSGLFNNMGLVYLDKNDPDGALAVFGKALDIDQANEVISDKIPMVENNIATAYLLKGDLDSADEYADRAIDGMRAQNEEKGSIVPHYPAALNTKGNIDFARGKSEEALEAFREALRGVELCYGKNVEYASECSNIAVICEKAGEKEEASKYRKEADEVLKRIGMAR
ncbi:MAG: tetratricopeptide repeat protein [Anaerovoracaceae bacterium]